MNIVFSPIGIIHSPYTKLEGMPIQPSAAKGIKGSVELNNEYKDALTHLDGFSHIYLIYCLHKVKSPKMLVKPFLEDQTHGLFATRAPTRPNPIGLSVVKLTSIVENVLQIENIDILDGTPLLDIKPYVPDMDGVTDIRIGWLEKHRKNISTKKSDERFLE